MGTAVALPRHKSLPQKVQAGIRNSPKPLYSGSLSISTAKFADLQVLKQFCDPRNANFYDLLPTDGAVPNSLHQELSDSESDSGGLEAVFLTDMILFTRDPFFLNLFFNYPLPFSLSKSLLIMLLMFMHIFCRFEVYPFSFSILKFCSSQNKIETLFKKLLLSWLLLKSEDEE